MNLNEIISYVFYNETDPKNVLANYYTTQNKELTEPIYNNFTKLQNYIVNGEYDKALELINNSDFVSGIDNYTWGKIIEWVKSFLKFDKNLGSENYYDYAKKENIKGAEILNYEEKIKEIIKTLEKISNGGVNGEQKR